MPVCTHAGPGPAECGLHKTPAGTRCLTDFSGQFSFGWRNVSSKEECLDFTPSLNKHLWYCSFKLTKILGSSAF